MPPFPEPPLPFEEGAEGSDGTDGTDGTAGPLSSLPRSRTGLFETDELPAMLPLLPPALFAAAENAFPLCAFLISDEFLSSILRL